jgi:hypothetical protein
MSVGEKLLYPGHIISPFSKLTIVVIMGIDLKSFVV